MFAPNVSKPRGSLGQSWETSGETKRAARLEQLSQASEPEPFADWPRGYHRPGGWWVWWGPGGNRIHQNPIFSQCILPQYEALSWRKPRHIGWFSSNFWVSEDPQSWLSASLANSTVFSRLCGFSAHDAAPLSRTLLRPDTDERLGWMAGGNGSLSRTINVDLTSGNEMKRFINHLVTTKSTKTGSDSFLLGPKDRAVIE